MKVFAAAAGFVVLAQSAAPAPLPDVAQAAEWYSTGDHSAAVSRVLFSGRLTAGALTSELDRWIAADAGAGRWPRRLAASAFALDVAWTATRSVPWNKHHQNLDLWGKVTPNDPNHWSLSGHESQGYVAAWIVRQATQLPGSDLRKHILLATIGAMEDGHAWHLFEEALPSLRSALPHESRLRLAEVLLESYRDLGALRMPKDSRLDVVRDEDLPSRMTRHISRIQARYEALTEDASLAGEALLRAGYLELRRRDWKAAVTRFEAARARQTEAVLRAATDYFLGWTHTRLGNDDAAIAAYRRALEITPTMRNLATELSALLFLRNERNEAYAILDRALNANDIPQDFMMIIERADARFVDGHLRTIREALQ